MAELLPDVWGFNCSKVQDKMSFEELNTSTSAANILFLLTFSVVSFYFLPMSTWIKKLWQYYVLSRVDHEEFPHLRLPPGTMGYPIVGDSIDFLKRGSDFYKEKLELHGNIYKTHLLGKPTIRVIGAENVKKVLLGENRLVTQSQPKSFQILFSSSAITLSTGEVHTARRKQMADAFGTRSLENMIPTIQEEIRSCLDDWVDKHDISVYPESCLLTFIVAASALVGIDAKTSRESGMDKTFHDYAASLFTLPIDIPGFGFHKSMQAKHKLEKHLREVLAHPGRETSTPFKGYFELCRELNTETEADTIEAILEVLFLGHFTVASSITSCVMLLGLYPEVVERLREEIERHVGTRDTSKDGKQLDYETIKNMTYLDSVCKEVLRLCPPVGAGYRKALKSFELGGFLVPKDWTVIYSIRETQQTSPIYTFPDRFNPDRWLEIDRQSQEFGADPTRFHYIPFGYGARNCVGTTYAKLVMKVFLIELVESCSWTLKNRDIKMLHIPATVPADNLPVTFKWRKSL